MNFVNFSTNVGFFYKIFAGKGIIGIRWVLQFVQFSL